MTQTSFAAWSKLWRELRAQGDPVPWHDRLIAAYSEPTRHYHTLQHLEECIAELDQVRSQATDPTAVAAALWFHDAVYNPRSTTNEEDSAALAVACLTSAHVSPLVVENVRQLILCTKSHEPGNIADASLLIDIDLAILGQPAARFWEYERAIRAEYAWVPHRTFVEKRSEILRRFVQRPQIYRTSWFYKKYEAIARENLAAAIVTLGANSLAT